MSTGAKAGAEAFAVPQSRVNLHGAAFEALRAGREQWADADAYCNPGPIQFAGPTAGDTTLTLQVGMHARMILYISSSMAGTLQVGSPTRAARTSRKLLLSSLACKAARHRPPIDRSSSLPPPAGSSPTLRA